MQKESIDLMNVEYEDVLQLYRGWRKSESALKDKNKELAALKSRITQLQDSHVKFRGQIQSLDSVKELTVTLQNQLSVMEQENRALGEENLELAQLNVRADELLREKETQEENQTKMLREVQMDVATLRGRYEEATRAHKEVEKLAADEQALRLATESRFNSMEDTISALRDENRELREQLDSAAIRMSQCDQEMLHASEQLGSLSKETSTLHAARQELSTKEAELALIKGDISRLLRLMEHSPATRGFLAHWQDSGGMDFVGIDRETSAISHDHSQHRSFEDTHHGLFNSTAHENTVLNSFELNPTEFAHLKRIHGGDPFPITTNLAEEAEYWVPGEAARLGLDFLAAKVPHASPKVIMDFLRSMNKIWLRRERRKIKRVKEVLGDAIEDLKRQLAQAKPYKGVIAERQIRRLKSQVKGERMKHLQGRPRSALELSSGRNGGRFEAEDQLDTHGDEFLAPHERRLCRLASRSKSFSAAPVNAVTTEKLLEASLNSLETMGRHMQVAGTNSILMGADGEIDISLAQTHGSIMQHSMAGTTATSQAYPNDSYLRGAMWLGRNFTILSEELAEEMSEFRTKFMAEVAVAGQDSDARRSAHRLTLLANSGITQAHSMTMRSNGKVREILQGASALVPGDAHAFKALLRTLPIESALTSSTPIKSPPASHTHHQSQHQHYTGSQAQNTSVGGVSLFNRTMSPLSTSGRMNSSALGGHYY